jgi:hypothetical protein
LGFPSNREKNRKSLPWKRQMVPSAKNGCGTIAELMARPRHCRIIRLDENVEVPEILPLYYKVSPGRDNKEHTTDDILLQGWS